MILNPSCFWTYEPPSSIETDELIFDSFSLFLYGYVSYDFYTAFRG